MFGKIHIYDVRHNLHTFVHVVSLLLWHVSKSAPMTSGIIYILSCTFFLYCSGMFQKHTYGINHNLHTSVHVVSEVVAGFFIQKVFVLNKISSTFIGTWGSVLVSPNKNHKIPQKTWFLKAPSKNPHISNYLQILQVIHFR